MFYLFQYYAESHGVIYVIDSTDEERLGESKNAFGEFCSIKICAVSSFFHITVWLEQKRSSDSSTDLQSAQKHKLQSVSIID